MICMIGIEPCRTFFEIHITAADRFNLYEAMPTLDFDLPGGYNLNHSLTRNVSILMLRVEVLCG